MRFSRVERTAHRHVNETRRALTVAREDFGHPHTAGAQRVEKCIAVYRARLTVRQNHTGVRRARVGIDRQTIE